MTETKATDLLYHYTRLSTAVEHILLDGRIRLSPLSLMRDPRESRDWLPQHRSNKGIDFPEGALAALSQELQRARARIKVLSLTENRPDADPDAFNETGYGYAHPRLWEHYADDHRGVCIAFNRDQLLTRLDNSFAPLVPFSGAVDYTDHDLIPGVNSRTVRDLGVEGAVAYLIEKRIAELVFRKTTDWETEVEFRIALVTDHGDYIHAQVRDAIDSVIIGSETPHVYMPTLHALCDRYEIPIYAMGWQNGLPWLEPRAPAFPPKPGHGFFAKMTLHNLDPEQL